MVGRDTRASGLGLERALAGGLEAAGSAVVSGGVLPTPAVALLAEESGAVISASHNPPEYNGVKFLRGGWKLEDDEEEAIEELLGAAGAEGMTSAELSEDPSCADRYVDLVCERFGAPLDGLRVAVDCANGAMYEVGPRALERLGAHVVIIGNSPDGTNINVGCGATDLALLSPHRRRAATTTSAWPSTATAIVCWPWTRRGRRSTVTRSSPSSPCISAWTSWR